MSSLWVFALSAVESYHPLPPVPISHLGTKLSSTVLLLFGLRVISIDEDDDADEKDREDESRQEMLSPADEMSASPPT